MSVEVEIGPHLYEQCKWLMGAVYVIVLPLAMFIWWRVWE